MKIKIDEQGEMLLWQQLVEWSENSPSGLVWKDDRFRGKRGCRYKFKSKGDPAGYLNPNRYYYVGTIHDGIRLSMLTHRVVYYLQHGILADTIDHLDGNSSNNVGENLHNKTHADNCKNRAKRCDNTTGITGVWYEGTGKKSLPRYKCHWSEGGSIRTKSFSINKLGDELAFFAACEYREQMINLLNLRGAGYTERHGK